MKLTKNKCYSCKHEIGMYNDIKCDIDCFDFYLDKPKNKCPKIKQSLSEKKEV